MIECYHFDIDNDLSMNFCKSVGTKKVLQILQFISEEINLISSRLWWRSCGIKY